jgi:hypothetical protein
MHLHRYLDDYDEVISLRVWGLMSRMGTPLACPNVPRGETPVEASIPTRGLTRGTSA